MAKGQNNDDWSKYIHTAKVLDKHRKLRFRDELNESFIKALDLSHNGTIIELGCGPGTLCGKLQEWYPALQISGFDRDINFINYARRQYKGIQFTVEDAAQIVDRKLYDYTISHTVFEYMPADVFFRANIHLLKANGEMLIISNLHQIGNDSILSKPVIPSLSDFYDSIITQEFDTSGIIQPQHYDEEKIADLLGEWGFQLMTVHYIADEIIPCNYSDKRLAEIVNVYEEIQCNKLYTTINKIGIKKDRHIKELAACIHRYYQDISEELKQSWPIHVDILRVIKARKRDECA